MRKHFPIITLLLMIAAVALVLSSKRDSEMEAHMKKYHSDLIWQTVPVKDSIGVLHYNADTIYLDRGVVVYCVDSLIEYNKKHKAPFR